MSNTDKVSLFSKRNNIQAILKFALKTINEIAHLSKSSFTKLYTSNL